MFRIYWKHSTLYSFKPENTNKTRERRMIRTVRVNVVRQLRLLFF